MQDLIAKGVDWFEAQRKAHLAVNVVYLPAGSNTTYTVPATIGGSRWDLVDSAGQMVRFDTRDYFIAAADYATAPRRGDRITEPMPDGTTKTYEVISPGGAASPWTWGDRGHRVRRIHTQLV